MRKNKSFLILVLCLTLVFWVGCKTNNNGNDDGDGNDDGNGNDDPVAIIIDHTCTDITKIPDQWITKVKEMLKVHYAHTSHGEQIIIGLERLAGAGAGLEMGESTLLPVNTATAATTNPDDERDGNSSENLTPGPVIRKTTAAKYAFWYDNCSMPSSTTQLTMMNGQFYDGYCETYVTPDLYWETDYGRTVTRSVLSSFSVNVSLWAWCTQLDYYSEAETQKYLDKMKQFESEFPNITFIYMTGNAQSAEQNRCDRNNQIRKFCQDNKKILFDFADLDCWYNGEQHKENGIPTQHHHYDGDEGGHTTFESCENKARAFWWMMARIAGWDGK